MTPVRTRRGVSSRSAATREAILDAALAVFPARGFETASMQEIAERADVHIPQLSYHFGSKLDLWKAVVDRAFAELRAKLDAMVATERAAGGTEPERTLLRGFINLVGRNPAFILLMHEEGKRKGPRMRWLVDRHVKPLYELSRTLLRGAKEHGLVAQEVPPAYFHYILAGAISFIFHQAEECKRVAGIDPFSEKSVAAHARAVEVLLFGPAGG